MNLKPLSTGCLTGYGLILDIRDEYVDSFVALIDEIGSLDAPERIAAGSLLSYEDGYCKQLQSHIWRP